MNTYPYIGKFVGHTGHSIVLFAGEGEACYLGGDFETSEKYVFRDDYFECEFTNITREYLADTKVGIESEEHRSFIQKMISKSDLWTTRNSDVLYIMSKPNNESTCKEIHIPLPPKEPKEVSMNEIKVDVTNNTDSLVQIKKSDDESSIFIYVNDPPKEPEPKDWPQVGDEVFCEHPSGQTQRGELLALTKEYAIIQEEGYEQHLYLKSWDLKKPLTPEEELAKELEKMVYDGMDNSYGLSHNCYYLVSGLMKKYDIKKKPE
ncbi:MAG: hypothetical protein Unbinned6284contig1001_32 [Prokaryotic dsDNA virus sp.]|nr:MAG: hypothetical protein Unbinned6284contig1001_32 [Prokaryotic dsDNA virus sp.]|tara:strand:- start:1722 stop:2507 length:786 start_codon:yes stop_codon:yes gene_type:complete